MRLQAGRVAVVDAPVLRRRHEEATHDIPVVTPVECPAAVPLGLTIASPLETGRRVLRVAPQLVAAATPRPREGVVVDHVVPPPLRRVAVGADKAVACARVRGRVEMERPPRPRRLVRTAILLATSEVKPQGRRLGEQVGLRPRRLVAETAGRRQVAVAAGARRVRRPRLRPRRPRQKAPRRATRRPLPP